MFIFISRNFKQTEDIGREFSSLLRQGDIVCLIGELGAGKTCFAKALIKSLGVKSKYINSPTFTFINEYLGKFSIYHFDLYRLKTETELRTFGYEEYFYGKGITLIEWADKIKSLLPENRLEIYFSYIDKNSRKIIFKPQGKNWTGRFKNENSLN